MVGPNMSVELTCQNGAQARSPRHPESEKGQGVAVSRDGTAGPDEKATQVPGEYGVWALIFGDFVVFGLFFITYSYYRSQNVALYAASQQTMHGILGLTNTLLLLTSSWLVALAVQRTKRGNAGRAGWLILCALVCGIAFCVIKGFDYGESIQAGIGLTTNEFYTFYFMFTGIHLMHVLIGMGVLLFMYNLTLRKKPVSRGDISALQSCGIFWHLVDILWIFLFALFYLMV
jgi:nitric oxide reductase NorE protein